LSDEVKHKRRWWLIALAVAAGLFLGWQAAALAQRVLGHGSGEARDAAITSPQAR